MHSKIAFVIILLLTVGCTDRDAQQAATSNKTILSESLEYKVASIDAAIPISESDTSIQRIEKLLAEAETSYSTPKENLADMATKASELAAQQGVSVKVSELLEWSLLACDTNCQEPEFSEFLAAYIMTRTGSGQTHHQTMHGLLILHFMAKQLERS